MADTDSHPRDASLPSRLPTAQAGGGGHTMILPRQALGTPIYPLALVLLAFGIVYAFSLTFVYIEGDDAASIAFHALGRRPWLQPPYAAHQGMMDIILRLAPAEEPALRLTAITLTSLAAVSLVALMLLLVFDWLGVVSGERRIVATLGILIVSPEFYYLGLVYTPSSIAMSLVLAAHLLMRRVVQRGGAELLRAGTSAALFPASLLLFGFGVACRWDTAAYGLVIVTDLLIGSSGSSDGQASLRPRRVILAVCWGVLAAAAVLGAIAVSGYGPADLYDVGRRARHITRSGEFSVVTLAGFQTLFTPAFVLLGAVGCVGLVWRRRALAVIAGVGILPVLQWMYSGIPKMILPAIPGMVLAVVHGLDIVWFASVARRRLLIARLVLAAAMVAPWIVGLRVYSPDTAWGPGFEITPPRGGARGEGGEAIIVDRGTTNRDLAVTKVKLTLEGGFAVPTQEGPRPLGGHASVLLGGRWRKLARQLDRERQCAVRRAIAARVPMLQDDGNPLLIIQLIQMGFVTNDPKNRFMRGGIAKRLCHNARGEAVTIYSVSEPAGLWDAGPLDSLISISSERIFVLYCGYSSTLRKLVEIAPGAVQPLGPFSGVVDIHRLREAIGEREGR